MSGEHNEVIDLTDSFTLTDCSCLITDIIELDESMYYFPPSFSPTNSQVPKRQRETNEAKNKKSSTASTYKTSQEILLQQSNKKPLRQIGECPVCWDELGKNPLASTKCGHVFCLQCIQQVLKQTPKCPTCRCILKGRSAYHPIYLSLQ